MPGRFRAEVSAGSPYRSREWEALVCGRQSYSTRGVREPGEIPGLTRSGEGDGRGNTPLERCSGKVPRTG